jgi:hypothetical protein
MGANQAISKDIGSLYNAINPTPYLSQAAESQYPAYGTAGTIGKGLGHLAGLAPIAAVPGGAEAATLAAGGAAGAEGVGNAREQAAQTRLQGGKISGAQEALEAMKQGGMGAAATMLAPMAASKIGQMLAPEAGSLAERLLHKSVAGAGGQAVADIATGQTPTLGSLAQGALGNRPGHMEEGAIAPKRASGEEPFKMVKGFEDPTQGVGTAMTAKQVMGHDMLTDWQHGQNENKPAPVPTPTEGHTRPGMEKVPDVSPYMQKLGIDPTPENVARFTSQFRRAGFAQNPAALLPKIGEEGTVARLTGTGQVSKTLRTMAAGTERDTHNIMTNLEPHFKTAENLFNVPGAEAYTPQAIGNFIDSIDKTGKSPYPELQPAVDRYMKMNADLIAREKAAGGATEGHTPQHIQFMARPTDQMLPVNAGRGLSGPEGYTYQRESKNWGDFVDKTTKAGMDIPYKNPLEMMAAGLAQRSRAVNAKEMVNDNWKPSGIADEMPTKGAIPTGWMKAPGIENTIVPNEVGKSLQYYYDSKAPSKDLTAAMRMSNAAAQSVRFMGDMVTATRAVGAGLGNTISMGLRTGDLGKYNPIEAYKRGRKIMTQSAEDLHATGDPADQQLATWLDQSVKAGLRPNGMKDLPRPDSERTVGNTVKDTADHVAHALNNYVTGPMKAGWANLAAEYSTMQRAKGKWSSQDAMDFTRRYIKFQDDAMGGSGSVNTAHPGIKIAADLVSPLWKYQTAGLRSSVRSLGEAVASKSISKSTIPEALSHITAHIALGVGAGLAISKATTGSAIPPTSPLDLFFPKIGKNNDGTDKRLGVAGIFLPLAEQITRLSKGELGKAGSPLLNPAITAAAQAITNHDWKGDTIGDGSVADRAWYFLKQSMSPITWSEMSEGNLAGAFAFRTAPKDISRSKAENLAVDLEQSKHTPQEGSTHTQESDWENRLRAGWNGKQWNPDAQKAYGEMKKAGYPTSSIHNLARRAQVPAGIKGVPYSNLDPQDILKVWQSATPDERKEMMPGMQERFSKVNRSKEKPDIYKAWQDLYTAVNAK